MSTKKGVYQDNREVNIDLEPVGSSGNNQKAH
jgi:hypothetical protein